MTKLKLLNTKVDNLTMAEAVGEIDRLIQEKSFANVVTPNLDHIVMLEKDEEFQEIYREAALVLTDGQPLVWYSKLKGTPIKEKVSGSDLFPEVCAMCARKGYSVFFFGAAEGVAETAAEVLKEKYPGLKIAGTISPIFGFEKNPEQTDEYIHLIREANADVLAFALGTPKGEKFAYRNREKLGSMVVLNIGATFNFIAGKVQRAPAWMSRCGLEWVYRMTQDPKRLVKRYWNDIKMIIPLVWKYRNQ